MGGKSFCQPFENAAGEILKHSAKCLYKPYKEISKAFGKLPNAGLYFCGFSIILVPLIVAYWTILLGFLLAEVIIFAAFGFLLGVFFFLLGVWPSLIVTLGTTGITIIRLPMNIYYHCLVTYRTVMLRRNIKLLSFILIPIVHLLIPPVTFIIALFFHVPWFSAISFAGFPLKPWKKIAPIHAIVWKKFATDVESFSRNYGHPSGIPMDWDGRVYGLPVDPIAVIISLFLYIFATIPVTIGVFLIFIIKAIPIFLGVLTEFWKTLNISKSLKWYKGVVTGSQAQSPPSSSTRSSPRSGHAVWSSTLKKSTKGIQKFIEGYAKMNICEKYGNIIKSYAKCVKKLHPKKLGKMISGYCEDLSPLKLIPSEGGLQLLCLWIPILLTSIMWVLGLILVLTIPPGTFLLALLVWILGWIPVFILPPVFYILGWIFIIFGLPVLYILLWGLILVGPWVFVVLGSLSGPLLALQIPFAMLTNNFYNPVEMWSSIKHGLAKVLKIFRSVDRVTANLSIGKVRLSSSDTIEEDTRVEERGNINYWDLYIERCIKEARRIRNLGWISQDDIESASSSSMIAIPGVTIVAILVDSIKRNKKDKTMIYWNEDNKCRDSNRDYTDNVVNLFWPQLMKVKEGLISVDGDLDSAGTWVSASLCDGEDERSDQLKGALENITMKDNTHQKYLKIRSQVENIVHSLLRVQGLTSRLHEIFEIGDDEEPPLVDGEQQMMLPTEGLTSDSDSGTRL
eukprot:GFUD01015573.1.p1 GENE.GFUD01015573.1~~GFUD01015573.1.p1  ORF type:complete len:737 (+),score=107.38 GFUD01015573.1:170-2380(+)